MDINKELKEWIELFCQYDNAHYENLSEGRMLEIREYLKKDRFSEEQINNAINKYEINNHESKRINKRIK